MTAFLIIALIFCVLASGYFSASETALFSLSPMQVRGFRKSDSPTKRLIARLLASPRGLLVTILMMNVLVNLLVQNISASLFKHIAGWWLAVGLPFILTLFFGELIPKSIALPNNERIARVVAPPLAVLSRVLSPLRRLITKITTYTSRVMFFFLRPQKEISAEEIEHTLRISEKGGVLTSDETEFIRGYLHFQMGTAKELMRPRDEVVLFEITEPLDHLIHLFRDEEISRLPVAEGGLDNILGIMESSEFFFHEKEIHSPQSLKEYLRCALYVPESMSTPNLWRKMVEHQEEMAVVVDEYGSITGILTREDLVEEIIGEIADRRDEKQRYTRAGPDVMIASGKMELSEFNDLMEGTLQSENNLVTLGGWIVEQVGHIPTVGTQYQACGFLFHVLAADPNRVRRIYVRRVKEPSSE